MNKQKTHRSTHPPDKAKQDIPDRVIESLARCALPLIRAYFESEEGRREFEEWKNKGKLKYSIRDIYVDNWLQQYCWSRLERSK